MRMHEPHCSTASWGWFVVVKGAQRRKDIGKAQCVVHARHLAQPGQRLDRIQVGCPGRKDHPLLEGREVGVIQNGAWSSGGELSVATVK